MKFSSLSGWMMLCLIALGTQLLAQDNTLIGYYSFDDCTATDRSPSLIGGNGTVVGNPVCECGVSGDAMVFDGIDDYITFDGNVNGVFQTSNFTIAFYFKPYDAVSSQNIISKRVDCTGNGGIFDVEYLLSLNFINTNLNESPTRKISISSNLDFTCWHHYALTRANNRVTLYLNGQVIDEKVTSSVLDLSNSGLLSIAESPCIGTTTDRFRGKFDELYIYNRALSEAEIQELFLAPDMIGQRDQIIYLGESVEATVPVTCANSFTWTPADGVDNFQAQNPTITPTATTTYQVSVLDDIGCVTTDTIKITVIDPSTLNCSGIFLPKAFTPNNDGLNDTYGISNPQAIENLVSFDIFDRWGTRVFSTANSFETWDGVYKGQLLNAGIFVYQVTYICEGQEYTISDTFSMLR